MRLRRQTDSSLPEPNAEPVPEWPAAKEQWQWAWELHYIGFGTAFLMLAFWCIVSIVRARNLPLTVSRRYWYAVNILLIIFGVTRSLSLFLFPYEIVDNTDGTPLVLERLLYGTGFPCLLAGFTLIHCAFLETVKIRPAKWRVNSLRLIIPVVGIHFSLVLVTEVVTSYMRFTSVLRTICMLYFVIGALVVAASIFFSGFQVVTRAKNLRRTLNRFAIRGAPGPRHQASQTSRRERNTNKVARVTLVTAFFAVTTAAVKIYAMVEVFKIRNGSDVVPQPWPWWIYVTFFRLTELAFAFTMLYAVSPRKTNYKNAFQCCFKDVQHKTINGKESATNTPVRTL